MDQEKMRILGHSSNIFFNLSIGMMIICYLGPIIFAFDLFSFLGSFVLLSIFGSLWIIVAFLGVITALLAVTEYRTFVVSFGKFVLGLFDTSNVGKITSVIANISSYYWIFVAFAFLSLALFFTSKAIMHDFKNSKGRVITLSVMGVICIVSVVISAILIGRLQGGIA